MAQPVDQTETATSTNANDLSLSAARKPFIDDLAQTDSETDEDGPLRIQVEGQVDDDVEPDATTGTRTETPILKIPQSLQVIPAELLEEQQVIRLEEALRNAPGVIQGNTFGGSGDNFIIRGFEQSTILRDGFRTGIENFIDGFRETANLEQIEVLRGPASVLYGNVEPGGVINLVTKQPLDTFWGEFDAQLGTDGFARTTLDVTGPLSAAGTMRYRLNAVYERADSFRNFETDVDRVFFAPTVAVDLGDRTDLIVELEYLNDQRPFDRGIPALEDEVAPVPRTTTIGEPNDFARVQSTGVGYRLEHRFSPNWRLRNRFRYGDVDFLNRRTELSQQFGGLDPATGTIARTFDSNNNQLETYEVQTEVIGEFVTGSINHTLLAAVDLFFANSDINTSSQLAPPVNLFNPQTGLVPPPDLPLQFTTNDSTTDLSRVGLLLQDQIEISPQWNLLLGGRVDFLNQISRSEPIVIPGLVNLPGLQGEQSDTAFSPRVGLVYQPIQPLAFYASYSRSFQPNTLTQTTATGEFLDPEEGEQFEVGAKAELFNGQLAATLALFNISQTNIAATDPNNPQFVVPIGEQTSRGIELDVTGEILPGWNILAGVSLLNANIEDSPDFPSGATPRNVPSTTANLWTTYEIQAGNLAGLGFGLGLFYVGERFGDNANTFTLDDYLRTDAAIYYQQNDIRLGLNIRNLFDVTYFESGVDRRGAIPGDPFTIIGSFAVKF